MTQISIGLQEFNPIGSGMLVLDKDEEIGVLFKDDFYFVIVKKNKKGSKIYQKELVENFLSDFDVQKKNGSKAYIVYPTALRYKEYKEEKIVKQKEKIIKYDTDLGIRCIREELGWEMDYQNANIEEYLKCHPDYTDLSGQTIYMRLSELDCKTLKDNNIKEKHFNSVTFIAAHNFSKGENSFFTMAEQFQAGYKCLFKCKLNNEYIK